MSERTAPDAFTHPAPSCRVRRALRVPCPDHSTNLGCVVKPFDESQGSVIVPARLAHADAVEELTRVISSLSSVLSRRQRIVVVAQPDPPTHESVAALFAARGRDPRVSCLILNRPVGKWPAVGQALTRLPAGQDWIAVFDGDGAFSAGDLPALVEPVTTGQAVHVIGRRRAGSHCLEAVGQTSADSRVHLEAFFNTLALRRLGVNDGDTLCGFDIQCGFHVFGKERSTGLTETTPPFYGGELLAFIDTRQRGERVAAVDVTVGRNPPSTYRMSEIVDALLHLPLIATAGVDDFAHALTTAPRWYRHWGLDRERFEDEIRATVLVRATGRGGER